MDLTAEMRDWIIDAVGHIGHERLGPIEMVRARPWAVVCTIDSDRGPLWAKMPHPAFAYEGHLAVALDRLAPGTVHAPLVVGDHGWMLSADGGPTFTDRVDGSEAIAVYRTIADATVGAHELLLQTGAPDRRPTAMASVWSELVDGVDDPDLRHRAQACTDRVLGAFAVLADDGRLAVCNTDLRPSHAFAGPPVRIFDWGDATVAHPLCSLGAVRNFTRDETARRDLVSRLWGPQRTEVVRAAGVVESLLRADVWRRDPPGARERHPGMIDFWMADALDQLDAG